MIKASLILKLKDIFAEKGHKHVSGDLAVTSPADKFLRDDGSWQAVEASGSIEWNDVQNKPSEFPPEVHIHNYEPANANIQAHISSTHAPADAQKNSDITKAEIEEKLTGEISSHSHAGGGGGLSQPQILARNLGC